MGELRAHCPSGPKTLAGIASSVVASARKTWTDSAGSQAWSSPHSHPGVAQLSHGAFAWRTTTYEFISDRPAIDLLVGGPEFRTLVDAGQSIEAWLLQDDAAAQGFAAQRRPWLLY
jgi:hypothetical protein